MTFSNHRHSIHSLLCIVILSTLINHCAHHQSWDSHEQAPNGAPKEIEAWISAAHAPLSRISNQSTLRITYPTHDTVFPPNIAAPKIEWTGSISPSQSNRWLVTVAFQNRGSIYSIVTQPWWTPEKTIWERIKSASKAPAKLVVTAFDDSEPPRPIATDRIRFFTSNDPVDATILYRQVPLPFNLDEETIRKMRWRHGDISSYEPPAVIMKEMPVCASCHMVNKDGTTISMEMNFNDDNGAHLITPIQPHIQLDETDFMTWSDFEKPEILPATRGLFAKMSPSGRYLVGTVHDISYMALLTDPTFSQLFFPTYGVLAWWDSITQKIALLGGADDPDFIQTDPSWRWDETEIVFAKSDTMNHYLGNVIDTTIRVENRDIHALNAQFPIQFNLYKIPFKKGTGGKATPIEGASFNGMSNYFARYSPDGRFIVFTMSKTGIMLQPDSELYIIPSQGGQARRMRCNTKRFNSWHSFSPNGRWLLFSTKARSSFTEIMLTHIDAAGMDTPPVRISRFNDNNFAANVPEFVNIELGAIEKIDLN